MSKHFPLGAPDINNKNSFKSEFASLLHDNSDTRILFIQEEQVCISALAWKSFILKNGLKIAALGLVVTDPTHRKKGYAQKLIKEAEAQALKEDCVLMCLWSDLYDYYNKLGYHLAGSELSWKIGPIRLSNDTSAYKIRRITKDDIPQLLKNYKNEFSGPDRNENDFLRQIDLNGAQNFICEKENFEESLYAFANKGRDLKNIIHEIGGDLRAVPALLEHYKDLLVHDISEEYPLRLQFPYNNPQTPELEKILGEAEQGALCFAKVLRTKAFVEQINIELKKQSLNPLELKYHGEEENNFAWSLVENGNELFISPDPAHLLQIFCSPWPLENLEGLPGRVIKRLEGWKPYPLYFWGLDSV